jgi:hypothetical protein
MAKVIVKVWIEDDNQNQTLVGTQEKNYTNNNNMDLEFELVHSQGTPIVRPKNPPKY